MYILYILVGLIFTVGFLYYILHIAPKFDPRNRAEEFIRNNKVDDAIIEYNKLLEENQYDFVTHFRLGEIYLRKNEIDKAQVHFETILDHGSFNYEVDKVDVQKKLASIYFANDDIYNTFKIYLEILKKYPGNEEAIYHAAFISLGQDEFDFAGKMFNRLIKMNNKSFDVQFGAGICAFENQKVNDAVEYFRKAAELKPDSDIASLAAAIALRKKSNYNKAQNYVEKLLARVDDADVRFVLMRLEAFILLQLRKYDEAMKKFELLLQFAKNNNYAEETNMVEYDLGFVCIKSEKTGRAYDYWNKLYEKKRNYKNLPNLIMTLRREMDNAGKEHKEEYEDSTADYADEWMKNAFSPSFLWDICGLKSEIKIDLKNIIAQFKTQAAENKDIPVDASSADIGSADYIATFVKLDTETFRIISNRLVEKAGYKVDEILQTYRESDGVDFMARDKATDEVAYVWVRRWTKMKVGEISLRNLAQAVNDMKAKQGVLFTTADLTENAAKSMDMLSKIRLVLPDELNGYLKNLI